MLKEAEWLRTFQPICNRRRKGDRSFTLLPARPGLAAPPGPPVEPVAMDKLEAADLQHGFGVFHSDKDARKALGDIARAQQLCLKVLGLEDSPGSCLAYQCGRCRGACAGKEPRALHDVRLMVALSSLKLKAWPFPGRVALRERDFRGSALHVVDHWSYLGTARSDEELAEIGAGRSEAAFDPDVYRILVRHFGRNPNLDWIDLRAAAAVSSAPRRRTMQRLQ